MVALPAAAAVRSLTLYQKTARASLVARVRSTSDSARRPRLDVLAVYKGRYASSHLFIVPFREDYANPKPWLRTEVFRKGREYVLFLDPYDPTKEDDAFTSGPPRPQADEPENQLFVVLNANRGVLDIPSEGEEALIGALKRFGEILALREHDPQAEAFRDFLRESNPYLVEAGLAEVARFRLATEEDLEPLLAILASPRAIYRRGAARILGQLGEEARLTGRALREHGEVFDQVANRAFNDRDPGVRAEAARSIGLFGGSGAREILMRIGRQDPDQEVRYQAEVALLEMKGEIRDRDRRR
jgi:hypothetical protein